MGTWNDAYERLQDAQRAGASTAQVEEQARKELEQLLGEDK